MLTLGEWSSGCSSEIATFTGGFAAGQGIGLTPMLYTGVQHNLNG